MSIASYSDLNTAVSNWLFGRTDLVARVPEFIALCEATLNRTLFCRQMEARSIITLNTASLEPEFVTLPWDFQSMRRVRLINTFSPDNGTGKSKPRIHYYTGAQLDDYRDRNPQPNAPTHFTIFSNEMELAPTPDQNYMVEMVYRQSLLALNTTPTIGGIVQPLVTTNWLLAFAPDAYLYGTLMQAAPFLRDNDNIPIWKGLLDKAVTELNDLSEKSTYNAGPLVLRRRRSY